MERDSTQAESWWIQANVAAVLSAFFRAEPQTDWQRRGLASQVLNHLPTPEYGDAICTGCDHEIDTQCCHCGDSPKSHGWDHSFVPQGCTCGYHDAAERTLIPRMVL